MAEIGVLNLTIHDNSENAAKGLDRLAGALRAVKEAKQKFNLDGVGQQLTNLAKTIQEARGTSTIIKNLGTMFNAINQFAKMKDFTIDTQKLRDTAQAMIQLADAKERVDTVNKSTAGVGDWRTGMNGVAESTKAAVNEVKKDVDVFEDTIKRAKDIAGDSKGTWEMAMRTGAFATAPSGRSSGSLLPMNLQLFGGKGEVDGLKETEGVIQQSTETISKFKKAVSDTADPVKNIDLNKYLGTPLESIFNKATMAETAIRRVGDAMAHALTNMSGSAMEKAIAGNAKLATQEISGLFKMLEKKPKYDGLRQFVDAITGVTRGTQGGNVINENTTMLGPIVEQEEKLERLNARIEEATAAHYKLNEAGEMYAGTIRIFDQAEGRYKEISVDAKAIAESTADAKEKTEDYTSSIRNVIDLTKVPASGKNGVFANAAEEAKYLKEQIESTIASQEQWLSIRAAAEKQIKYGEPRSKEDLDFDMRHSEEGYYAALEAEEQYKNSLTDLLGYAKEYTETARQATEATTQQAESMNTAADAAERLNDAVAESASADVIAAQAAVNQHAIQQLMDTLNNPPNVRFVDIVDDLNGVDRTAMSARESMSAFLEAMQGDDEYASYIRDLNPELADLSDKVKEAGVNFSDLKEVEKIAKQETDKLSFSIKDLRGAIGKLFPGLTGLIKRFKGMVISRSIRYVIRKIASGFSEGVQNVYKYSEAVGTSFAPAMDEAASALMKMKNSLGAALAPAIQALIPVLQQVVNWFINLINYVNQFLALIRGQKTWTRAVDYTTKAYKDQTKEAKKASAAVKDLLADWDELNIIQSEAGGGGGVGKKDDAEEYLKMFEEVDKFDSKVKKIFEFIKENLETFKGLALGIGAAILGWKISKAFADVLPVLSKIGAGVSALATIGITLMLTDLLGNAYIKTGDPGWLIADALTGVVGAEIAGELAKRVLGTAAGTVTKGFTLILAGTINIKNALSAVDQEKDAEAFMLGALGSVEVGLGAALAAMGFGASAAVSLATGVVTGVATLAITIGLIIKAQRERSYYRMAMDAFKETGKGGISPADYMNALQKRFTAMTKNSQLVIDTRIGFDKNSETFEKNIETLKSLNSLVTGEDALSKEDAKKFKEAWGLVIESLGTMQETNSNTILAGLDEILADRTSKIREAAVEYRREALWAAGIMKGAQGKLEEEIKQLENSIISGPASKSSKDIEQYQKDLERYEFIYKTLSKDTEDGLAELKDTLKKGSKFDFSQEEKPVQAAVDFINSMGPELITPALDKVNEQYKAEIAAIDSSMQQLEEWKTLGYVDDTTYKRLSDFYTGLKGEYDTRLKEQTKEITKSTQSAFNTIIDQAIEGYESLDQADEGALDSYVKNVFQPLYDAIESAGGKVPEKLKAIMARGGKEAWESSTVDQLRESTREGIYQSFYEDQQNGNLDGNALVFSIAFEYDNVQGDASKIGPEAAKDIINSLYKVFDSPYEILFNLNKVFGWSIEDMVKNLDLSKLDTDQLGELMDAIQEYRALEEETLRGRYSSAPGTPGHLELFEYEEELKKLEESYKEIYGSMMKNLFPNSNADLLNRPMVELGGGDYATLLTTTYSASKNGKEGMKWNQDLVLNLTAVTPDGKVLNEQTLDKYVEELLGKSANLDELFWNDKLENGGKGLLISADIDFTSLDEGIKDIGDLAWKLHELQEEYYEFQRVTNGKGAEGLPAKVAQMGAAGVVGGNRTMSDVGWGNGSTNEPQPVEIDFTGMTASVQKGSQEANRDVVDGLAAVVLGLQRLLGKEWSVNISPSTALGRTVGRSNSDLETVTGYYNGGGN